MAAKRIGKKFLKTTGIIVGSFVILLTAFHFWFVYHAEEIIQDLVSSRSDGRIQMKVENFKFNWFSKKMELEDAVFYTTDSATSGTAYRFAVRKINLKVKSVYPMIFENSFLINTLSLKDPDIVVTRLRAPSRDTTKKRKEDVSIPEEMGRIYNSIQDALKVLQVKKFEIEDATFTLLNKMRPDELPLKITHIDFHIDNLKVDTAKLTGKEKIFFSDNVVLKSRDQDIIFPDGRHRLSYRKFRINIEKKIVEFDSCTIAAIRKDSASSDFSIFFDELVMTNIDFDTLYRAEVIKADSVYCINPQIKLNVNLDKRAVARRGPPKLDQIIRQLTGDMLLNFVVVNNASFDINTVRNGHPNSYKSENNNFEIQGLSIDKELERPLKVKKFAMAIRNYENFLRDSTYEMQFDSVLFADDKIFLNDFTFRKMVNGKTVNRFKVPRFQMTGLSWDDLLFEQKLTAHQATLYDPEILFTQNPREAGKQKKKTLFEVLATINEVVMLGDLNIVNGDIDIRLVGGVNLKLDQATFSVESRSFLGSSQLSGIRRSVNYLDFKKGVLKIDDIVVRLDDINYTGVKSRLKAGTATIHNQSGTLDAMAKNVTMDEILIDEFTGDVSIGGVSWQEAEVKLHALPSKRNNSGRSFISLTDINGNNTRLSGTFNGKTVKAHLDHIEAVALLIKPGENPMIGGLALSGKELDLSDEKIKLGIAAFEIADMKKATLQNLSFRNIGTGQTTAITIPLLSFIPDIQSAIGGEIRANEMRIHKPLVRIDVTHAVTGNKIGNLTLPPTHFNKLVIEQPDIQFNKLSEKGNVTLEWDGKKGKSNEIVFIDVNTTKNTLSARQLLFSLNNFLYTAANGRKFDAGNGSVTALLENIDLHQDAGEISTWNATLSTLEGKDFVVDSLGKKAGRLAIQSLQIKDLAVNSSTLGNIRHLIAANTKFRIQQVTGDYVDMDNRFTWYNAGYDKSSKTAFLDSFRYSPTPPKDVFVASKRYQTDYLQIKTGAVNVGPFDIDSYLRDTVFRVGRVKIDDVDFNDFRDNRLPFRSGIIKPLMVNRIKSIPVKIDVDTLVFNNADITYAELNPKTNQTGIILFNRTVIKAFPFRNFNFGPTDSLRIHANGYLMDSIWVRLRLKESYTDTLSGFLLTLRMRPVDMKVLNPVLIPLASASLRSGKLDTLLMRVAGGEYLAFGEMNMRYHDLKIDILRNGTPQRRGLISMLANSFIIKNKNVNRTSKVFFIRNRERSPINYLIKILMSGVNSSIGAKSNRKVIRQYKKELGQRNLPPVDYD